MKKLRKKRIPPSINKLFTILIFIVTVFMSVGYASINSIIMNIDGEVVAKAQDGIYITEIEYVERDNSLQNENYSVSYADNTLLKSSINLEPNDLTSEVSLKVSFYNSTEYDYIFKDIVYAEELTDEIDDVYSNPDIVYTFTNQNEIITKNGGTLDVIITFKYSSIDESTSNILNSILNFKFDLPVHIVATYDYKGYVETFVAPYTGIYQLEVWGAQGGSYSATECIGGYGGYSVGEVKLLENQPLYIVVGGKGNGNYTHTPQTGGYNGGGSASSDTDSHTIQASGGGATHIATYNRGILSNYELYLSEILIVAGGGGGSSGNSEIMCVTSGSGGGYAGGAGEKYVEKDLYYGQAFGGTQSSGGTVDTNVGTFNYSIGVFGQGGGAVYTGGGGGFYGGSVAHSSAGGGSGYIANPLLTNKCMTCFNCLTSTEQDIRTNNTTNISETAVSGHAKVGNGFAKITYLRSE